MLKAGDYSTRMTWKAVVRSPEDLGNTKPTYPSVTGYLWCAVEPTSQRLNDLGADRPGGIATIRVRNRPAVSPDDVLIDTDTGETWFVKSRGYGDNELVLDCERFEGETRD